MEKIYESRISGLVYGNLQPEIKGLSGNHKTHQDMTDCY